LRWDGSELTFTATKWELPEASLVTMPADASASVRSLGGDHLFDIVNIRTRMETRQRMHVRQSMYDRQARVIGKHNE
jgi:hypothetical protein